MRSQATISALALVTSVNAFWRMPCRSQTGVGRLDPIMDPGEISDHVHTISGGGGMSNPTCCWSLLTDFCGRLRLQCQLRDPQRHRLVHVV